MEELTKSTEKLTYEELREEIHKILFAFLEWELKCNEGNEFDSDWVEYNTDDILNLIKRQGGTYE